MGSLSRPLAASLHPNHLEGLRPDYAAGVLSGLLPGGGKQRVPPQARIWGCWAGSKWLLPWGCGREGGGCRVGAGFRTSPLLGLERTLWPLADPKHPFPLLESHGGGS